MNKTKKLSVVFILAALLTAATSACAFASMSLPRSANDCLDGASYKLDLAPLSSDNTTELYISNTELWSYGSIRSEIGQNALDQIDNWDATLVGVWGPFEKTTGYDEAVRRIKLDASQATVNKMENWNTKRLYLYFITTDNSGNNINVVAKGWFDDFLITSGSDYDYFDVSGAIQLSDWNTQNLYVFMVRDDRDNDWGSGSGCNTGFGALALLAVIPLILRKKK
jgi:Synergist-CTERM protein sorting domain-containing protein